MHLWIVLSQDHAGSGTLHWRSRGPATGSGTLHWTLRGAVTGSRTLHWRLRGPVTGSGTLHWRLRGPATGSGTLHWTLLRWLRDVAVALGRCEGRYGGMFGTVKRTFCYMKRSSCRGLRWHDLGRCIGRCGRAKAPNPGPETLL